MIEGLVSTVLHGTQVVCTEDDYKVVNLPGSMDCNTYMGAYVAQAGGYLEDPSATGKCKYCQYSSGDAYLSTMYDWDVGHRWRNLGFMLAYCTLLIFTSVSSSHVLILYSRCLQRRHCRLLHLAFQETTPIDAQ